MIDPITNAVLILGAITCIVGIVVLVDWYVGRNEHQSQSRPHR